MKKISIILLILILASVASAGWKTTKEGYWGAPKLSDFNKMQKYIEVKDYEALQKMIDKVLIFKIKKGLTVQIVDTEKWGAVVQLRPKGEEFTFWTVVEAVH